LGGKGDRSSDVIVRDRKKKSLPLSHRGETLAGKGARSKEKSRETIDCIKEKKNASSHLLTKARPLLFLLAPAGYSRRREEVRLLFETEERILSRTRESLYFFTGIKGRRVPQEGKRKRLLRRKKRTSSLLKKKGDHLAGRGSGRQTSLERKDFLSREAALLTYSRRREGIWTWKERAKLSIAPGRREGKETLLTQYPKNKSCSSHYFAKEKGKNRRLCGGKKEKTCSTTTRRA